MVPRQPGELSSVGTDARRRIEIIAFNQHTADFIVAFDVETGDRADGLNVRVPMIFSNTDQTTAPLVQTIIAKSGAVWVDGPQGPYVSATAVHIPDSETRRLVKP